MYKVLRSVFLSPSEQASPFWMPSGLMGLDTGEVQLGFQLQIYKNKTINSRKLQKNQGKRCFSVGL